MRKLLLFSLLVLTGCAHRPAKVAVLSPRDCREGTKPFPAIYKPTGNVIDLCAIVSADGHIVDIVPPGVSPEVDGDDDAATGDKEEKEGRRWWLLWLR